MYNPYDKGYYDSSLTYYVWNEAEEEYEPVVFVNNLRDVEPYYSQEYLVFNLETEEGEVTDTLTNIRPLYRYQIDNIIIDGNQYYFKNHFYDYERFYFYYTDPEDENDYAKNLYENNTLYLYDENSNEYIQATGEFDITQEYYERVPRETVTLSKQSCNFIL